MTGRGAGYGAGYGTPGYVSTGPGRGFARGCGRGFGRGAGWWQGAAPRDAGYALPTRDQELAVLKEQSQGFETALENIQARIAELETTDSAKN